MKKVRLVCENNLNCLEEKVRNASWNMLDENNVDSAYDKFHNHFQHLYNEALPVKNKTRKSSIEAGIRRKAICYIT